MTPLKPDYEFAFAHIRPKPPTMFVTLAYNMAQGGSGPQGTTHQLGQGGVEHRASARRPLHFNLSALRLTSDLRKLDAAVHGRLFGRNFFRLKFERRLFWIAVREGRDANPHVHMAWWVPGPMIRTFACLFGQAKREDIWRQQTGSGSSQAELVDGHLEWARYMLKTNPHLASGDDTIFLASQFWPAECRPEMAAT